MVYQKTVIDIQYHPTSNISTMPFPLTDYMDEKQRCTKVKAH